MEDANRDHALRSWTVSYLILGKIETREILKGLTLFKLISEPAQVSEESKVKVLSTLLLNGKVLIVTKNFGGKKEKTFGLGARPRR